MPKQYPKEQLEKLLEKLPIELQEAIFSLETAENILNTCQTYGIADEKVGQISDCVGRVLMGLLPPEEFSKTLEQEVGLPEALSQAIGREINRFIFYPLRSTLEELYRVEITPPTKPPEVRRLIKPEVAPPTEEVKPEVKPEEVPRKDIYREPVE